MKKILLSSLIVIAAILYSCTKESLQPQTRSTSEKNNSTLAGNKYLVSVNFKTKLKETTTLWSYKDKGSFLVTLDGGFGGTISNTKNYSSNVSFIKNTGTCDVQLIAANNGNVDLAPTGHVSAFGGQVYVLLDSANAKTQTPLFTINCDGNPYNDGGAVGPGAPAIFQFTDNGQKQVFTAKPYTITVTPQ